MGIGELAEYFKDRGAVVLLESQSKDHSWSRYTYLAALPQAEIEARGNTIIIREGNIVREIKGDPWEELQEFRAVHSSWLFGYLGYDLKNHTEQLNSANKDAVGAPDMYFMIPGVLLKADRLKPSYSVLKGELPAAVSSTSQSSRERSCSIVGLNFQISKQSYLSKVADAQNRIKEGDIYEVNLSHQLRGRFEGDPFSLYTQMKNHGPVPFGAYIELGELAICCQSPERFLRKEKEKIISQPIKGTSKRSHDRREDSLLKNQLLSSPKERAENLMIVDLVRNDLSRIARPGSVKVSKLFTIESFDTVHQMVSTITAKARTENITDIIKTSFPMGSMTGAPKIQAMRIIEELENYRRGIYSGAVGYITPKNDFDFNVVIRTALVKENELFYSTGGAITSDSDPESEWEETLIKAKALTDLHQSE